jgi:hypothetical protein
VVLRCELWGHWEGLRSVLRFCAGFRRLLRSLLPFHLFSSLTVLTVHQPNLMHSKEACPYREQGG